MEKTCGNCKHFIHQKLEKYGYDGYCRTFPKKIGVTELHIYEIYLKESSEICEFFKKKRFLNLKKLEKNLDEVLVKETKESLNKYLDEQRKS